MTHRRVERFVWATWPDRWDPRGVVFVFVLLLVPLVFGAQLVDGEVRWGRGIGLLMVEVALGVALLASTLGLIGCYLVTVIRLNKNNPTWRIERRQARALSRRDEVLRRIQGRSSGKWTQPPGHRGPN
jgi:hypothetical protein